MAVSKKLGVVPAGSGDSASARTRSSTSGPQTGDEKSPFHPKIATKCPRSDLPERAKESETSEQVVQLPSEVTGTPRPIESAKKPQTMSKKRRGRPRGKPRVGSRPKSRATPKKTATKRVTFADEQAAPEQPQTMSRRSTRKKATEPSISHALADSEAMEEVQQMAIRDNPNSLVDTSRFGEDHVGRNWELTNAQLVQKLKAIENWAMELKNQLRDNNLARENISVLQYGYATREKQLTSALEKLDMERSQLLGVQQYQRDERPIYNIESNE